MKKIICFALIAGLAFASSPASALGWNELGAQQFGMGGAGVADAQGPLAAYWNPAALGRPSMNSYGLAIPVDVEAQLKGSVIQGAKDLSNCVNGGGCTQAQINQALGELNQPGEGLLVNAGASGSLKIGKFTAFVNEFVDAGAHPLVDQTNTTVATIQNNQSALLIRGVRLTEVGLAYGHELPWTPGLYVGGDFKVMRAETGFADYKIFGNTSYGANDISKNLTNNTANSGNVGVDLGALWDVNKTFDGVIWSPHLGITGRNLNNPKFDVPDIAAQNGIGRYAVNPLVRTGLSFSPTNWWHFAADADLTKNITEIDNAQSQYVGAGTEIDVFNRSWINIPLRVGIKHNMADPTSGATFTAGTGVNLLHLIVDVSGEYSNQRISTQSDSNGGSSTSIPSQLGAAVQLSFLFGGADEHRHRHDDSAVNDSPVPSSAAGSNSNLDQSTTDKVRADAAQSQQELNNQPSH